MSHLDTEQLCTQNDSLPPLSLSISQYSCASYHHFEGQRLHKQKPFFPVCLSRAQQSLLLQQSWDRPPTRNVSLGYSTQSLHPGGASSRKSLSSATASSVLLHPEAPCPRGASRHCRDGTWTRCAAEVKESLISNADTSPAPLP